jgi:carbonic anhydrase
MSCISPIDIKDITRPCTTGCSYKYNYGNSSCILVNKGKYVKIQLDSVNIVTFNDANYSLSEARIYKPSLHTWDGTHTDAELVLNHTGSGDNMFICIPIKKDNGKGKTITFFNKFMTYIPTTQNSEQSVAGVNKFTLNDIVPNGPYYYYVGTSPWCQSSDTGGPSNKIIVFPHNYAVSMSISDFSNLSRISNSNQPVRSPTGGAFYNSEGTSSGPLSGSGLSGNTEVVDCVPVSIDGSDISSDSSSSINMGKDKIPDENVSSSFEKIPPWFWTFIAIVGGIIFIVVVYYIVQGALNSSRTTGGAVAAATAGATALNRRRRATSRLMSTKSY